MTAPPASEPSRLPRAGAAILFAVFLAWPVALVSDSGEPMADAVLLAALRLADEGTFTLTDGDDPKAAFLTLAHDIAVHDGRIYPGLGPGATVVAAPFRLLLRPIAGLFDEGVITNARILGYYALNARALGLPPSPHFLDLYLLQILLTWVLVGPLFAWFLVRLHRRLLEGGIPASQALAVTLATGFGSMTLYYASMYSRQALAYLVAWHALLSLTGRREPGARACLLAGAALGLAVAIDYPALLFAAVALPFPLLRLDARRRAAAVAGLLALLALTALYHREIFGDWLTTPYHHRYWHTDPFLAEKGIDLSAFQTGSTAGIGIPDPAVMARLCFGPFKGLFVYSPVLLLGLAGHVRGLRGGIRRRLHAMSLLLFATYLVLNSSLGSSMTSHAEHFWGGLGILWGPRYLFAVLPFLAWGMIRLDWSRAGVRWLVTVALGLSCLFNFAGTAFSHVIMSTPAFGDELRRPLGYALRLLVERGPRLPLLDTHGAGPLLQAALFLVLLAGSAAGLLAVHRMSRHPAAGSSDGRSSGPHEKAPSRSPV